MWTETTRKRYERKAERYASDVTDEEWALIAEALPGPRPLGRPRTTDLREVVNAIFYLLRTGCQWRQLPKDLPPYSTVHGYLSAWREDGTWQRPPLVRTGSPQKIIQIKRSQSLNPDPPLTAGSATASNPFYASFLTLPIYPRHMVSRCFVSTRSHESLFLPKSSPNGF
jgi:transposase